MQYLSICLPTLRVAKYHSMFSNNYDPRAFALNNNQTLITRTMAIAGQLLTMYFTIRNAFNDINLISRA